MRRFASKLLTVLIVAGYGSISVLGYGLHWLVPGHGHHHGPDVVCASHACQDQEKPLSCGHHHGAPQPQHQCCGKPEAAKDGNTQLAVRDGQIHSHRCEICAFLVQARAEQPKLITALVWQHVATATVAPEQRAYFSFSLSPHAPRGPPSQLG